MYVHVAQFVSTSQKGGKLDLNTPSIRIAIAKQDNIFLLEATAFVAYSKIACRRFILLLNIGSTQSVIFGRELPLRNLQYNDEDFALGYVFLGINVDLRLEISQILSMRKRKQ